MEKRILYIIPGTGIDDQEKERRAKVLNSFAGKEYAVEVEVAKIGPPSIESYNDEYLSIPETLSMVSGAEERGYAAIIIGCYSDPGIDAARELVNIPVVGPGQSTMLLATALGEEYSILCTLASVRKWLAKYARKVGAAERLVSVRPLDIHVLEMGKKSDIVKQRALEQGRRAITEDGADTLILGCMSEGFLGLAEEMTKELGVPVLNPVSVSVKTAELLVGCCISHSKLAYEFPNRKY